VHLENWLAIGIYANLYYLSNRLDKVLMDKLEQLVLMELLDYLVSMVLLATLDHEVPRVTLD